MDSKIKQGIPVVRQKDSKDRQVMLQAAGSRRCWKQQAMLVAAGDAAGSRRCYRQQAMLQAAGKIASGCFRTLSKRLKKTGHKCVKKIFKK